MAIVFPTSLDTLTNPTASSTLTAVPHATQHADINDAVEAIEAKLGVDSSAVNTSIDYLLKNANSLNPGHKHNASNILMTTLVGTPTYTTQNDFNNSFGSTGRKTGGVGSDVGSSKVAVTGGTGFIKATDDDNAQLLPFDWAAPADITIPANSSRYIGIEYNAGTPQVVSRTTSTWDFDTEFPLLRVVNDTINGAEELYIANTQWWVTDGMTNVIQALRSFGLVRRDEYVGGLILSGTGTRNVAVSGGTVWAALNDTAFAGLDTAVTGTFEYYWYKAGSGWQKSDATQYSVLQYNDISQTTLQNLSANKYANVWVYGEMNATGISIALVYPQAQYNTAAEAESKSAPDNLPAHISQLGMLLGRYIIKQNVDAPISTQSVFSTKFSTSVVTSHANLSNLDYASAGHTGFAPIASPTFTGTVKMNDGSVDRLEVGGIYTYIRGNTVLPKTLFINDTSGDQQYELAVSELAGSRTITLPLLTGNDEFVFKNHIQSITGLKTFDTTKLAVKGSSTGVTAIASANDGGTNYTATLPKKDGTVAMTSDIVSQVEDNITDGHTTIAPSGNAVFDALAGKLANVVEDTTPQLGGELDCQAHSIGFTQQTATGDGTTTIDWKLGNKFYFTFGNANETFTFTAPSKPCNLVLVLKQYSTGGKTATWPNTVMWPAGTAPTLSTGNNAIDIVSFYFNGTNYFGNSSLNFSVPA
jgi:hypothetical protein